MLALITITCIVLSVVIVALVLLQQGKGSDLGSAFGGGSSNSMFGALGPSNFMGKLTYLIVAIWLILTLLLAYLYKSQNTDQLFETPLIEEAIEENLINNVPEE
ncbi:MAG: preprotein translocase subunit SecG [Gammaproteobacteria bacterium TMED278]|jgi:preprotein translocase subunit SecG|nr:preprotein translocase subunit SecG [Gammaproteobacteria bacterium]OUX41579.1 MAG: preprotein translocase subunit SecG [Gammaproteobacteria bacterium TMED278]RCL36669.1 MAG: preprotein translocase subunit SecG [SAR86 cluster bacterium]MAV24341.1 preprotein translocase subunit SecG [Gammaproteobacteria bacterium]OUX42278.1 MAG: preprotein translocase subunit SecG [Gammaproteobacteria bacterium TMED278]|tara:strand:+ start:426 stop:737 length:312 start_codon:yes stop_codon:yes gene_type:complete